MNSSTPVVEADNVVRRYGARRALDDCSLTIPSGSVFGLLGPNGSGKSTFVTMVAAMDRPESGALRVFGQEPTAALRARVGTVFQENAQDPLMTVGETLALAGQLFGLDRKAIAERSRRLLEAFGIADRLGERIATLSGGMRRRVEMARALLHDPELLLLDEPTTGVDPDERRALWDVLIGRERGRRTILLATNDLAEADTVCEQVAFLRDGRVVASGSPGELKKGLRREALRVTWPGVSAGALDALGTLDGVGAITRDGDLVHITADDASSLVPRLFGIEGERIRAVAIDASSLEDAYFQFVGQRARDSDEVRA